MCDLFSLTSKLVVNACKIISMRFLEVFVASVLACTFILVASTATFLEDERAVLVEFYSDMCGSCSEFKPTWAKIEKAAKSVVTAKINIDDKEGLSIAESFGVLEEGLPNVRLFKSTADRRGVSIVSGTPDSYKSVIKNIKREIKGLAKRDDGMLLKASE